MRILLEGKIQRTYRCKHCGCEFEIEPKDIKRKKDKLGDFPTVECPTCKKVVTVKYYTEGRNL